MDTIIEVLIDNSNSMGMGQFGNPPKNYLLPDGSTRMELAKKILLEEIIPQLDYANKINIRKFHSIPETEVTSKAKIEIVYEGIYDISAISVKVNSIAIPNMNTGGTPITAAVKMSIDALAKHTDNIDRKIFLVTDGEETDGGDYKKMAEDAIKQYGIPCNIFIIGIAQDKKAELKSKELAQSTKGSYINLEPKAYSKEDLHNALSPIFIAVKNKKVFNNGIEKARIILPPIDQQILTVNELKTEDSIDDIELEIPENAKLNEQIRSTSEKFLFDKLKEKFGSRIKWLNEIQESGQSYDFEVLDTLDNSKEYFIECKASMHSEKVFLMTKKEWLFFLENKNKYQLYFISNALSIPQITKIDNLMEWIMLGKVLPFSNKKIWLKAERIIFTIAE